MTLRQEFRKRVPKEQRAVLKKFSLFKVRISQSRIIKILKKLILIK